MKHRFSTPAIALGCMTVILFLSGCDFFQDKAIKELEAFIDMQQVDKTNAQWKTALSLPPQLSFEDDTQYLWVLNTNQGEIVVKLMTDHAPMHASSTLFLTKLGFYDKTTFHRIIPGFMAQGGDPLGNGSGGPGYMYGGEFSPDVSHSQAGLLSMANRGPNTDGSQFFLTFAPASYLDGKHTIFGTVMEGEKVLKTLESLGSRSGRPSESVIIETATIRVE